MEKSLFWNALANSAYATGYDRNYNGDDISDWLATVLTTGVIKSNTALKVSPSSGMVVSVATGKAVINGKPYVNDAAKTFTVPTAPTGATSRIDLIVVRFDKSISTRATQLVYITGGSNGAIPAIKRDLTYYDLVLAKVTVQPNATAINAGDIVDLRGNNDSTVTTESGTSLGYCPWLVAVKGYDDYYDAIVLKYTDEITLASASTTVTFNIPQYGWTGVDLLTVYVNGVREDESNYTVSQQTITFVNTKNAGAKITVVVDKTIDGEGLGTALAQYQDLQTIVLGLQSIDDYYYTCTGTGDNIALSTLAQTWLNGGTDNSCKKINVLGTFGCTVPNAGTGTAADRYKWFSLGKASATSRRIIFDFSGCSAMTIPVTANTYNDIFFGENVDIIGANVVVNQTGAGTRVRVFSSQSGVVTADSCRFWVTSYQDSIIANNGTFTNCRGSVANTYASNSYCFLTSNTGVLRINGGTYYAYGASSVQSAIVGQSSADAVTILYGVNAPQTARSGFAQTHTILQYSGGGVLSCTDLISTLPMIVVAGISNIRGTLAKNKPQ